MADLTFPEPTLLYDLYPVSDLQGMGFIGGLDEGIVTVDGRASSRQIFLLRRDTMGVVREQWSNDDGTYGFANLDPEQRFLVIAVDHKKEYEPVAYDFVKPYVETDS